ncbi:MULTISPECIES: AmiS/UreI family transporter [Cryobacterium]|uniref:Transporter n=1 Tax=Cryobacterium breve TaxID=1259258 RepID=A0ABY2IVX9_9MICO|nr:MULTISPECIES: AmiS/UreI family transporter [Cryobacterium]TFC93582.1 transporter [Cryobacterium sp. TmT3-12]TFC95364.1 transporter [Cryobacterium breve]
MGAVGLLYVGAVLFINGLMLVGAIPGKSAGILNFFVGGMQVIFPTLIILGADGDLAIIFGAAGLYLFGFTYLYVAILQFTGISGEGLGWFSLFVVLCATVIGVLQFTLLDDPVFGVIWLIWAVLWFLFFLVLGLGKDSLTHTTGWFTIFISHMTGTIPAFLLLLGEYETNAGYALIVALAAALSLAAAWMLGHGALPARESPVPAESTRSA